MNNQLLIGLLFTALLLAVAVIVSMFYTKLTKIEITRKLDRIQDLLEGEPGINYRQELLELVLERYREIKK